MVGRDRCVAVMAFGKPKKNKRIAFRRQRSSMITITTTRIKVCRLFFIYKRFDSLMVYRNGRYDQTPPNKRMQPYQNTHKKKRMLDLCVECVLRQKQTKSVYRTKKFRMRCRRFRVFCASRLGVRSVCIAR